MPVMNGVELAIAISKMLPEAKILLFSGQAGISDVLLEGHNQGYDFELAAKPIHPEKLIERLKSIADRQFNVVCGAGADPLNMTFLT